MATFRHMSVRHAKLDRGMTSGRASRSFAPGTKPPRHWLAAEAWVACGIEPPTTPIFNWHDPCGPVEEALHGATGRILEEAIDSGVVTLGQPDTDDQRVALTMRLMISPDNDGADTWFVRL